MVEGVYFISGGLCAELYGRTEWVGTVRMAAYTIGTADSPTVQSHHGLWHTAGLEVTSFQRERRIAPCTHGGRLFAGGLSAKPAGCRQRAGRFFVPVSAGFSAYAGDITGYSAAPCCFPAASS